MNFTGIQNIDDLVKIATEITEEDIAYLKPYRDFILSMDTEGVQRTKATQKEIKIPQTEENRGNGIFLMLSKNRILGQAAIDNTMGPLWKDIYYHPTMDRPFIITDVNKLNELQSLLQVEE